VWLQRGTPLTWLALLCFLHGTAVTADPAWSVSVKSSLQAQESPTASLQAQESPTASLQAQESPTAATYAQRDAIAKDVPQSRRVSHGKGTARLRYLASPTNVNTTTPNRTFRFNFNDSTSQTEALWGLYPQIEPLHPCQERLIITHHKSGTVLNRKVGEELQGFLQANGCQSIRSPWRVIDRGGMRFWRKGYDYAYSFFSELTGPLAHFQRNVFEMIVSGYLYHKSGAEMWTTARLKSRLDIKEAYRWVESKTNNREGWNVQYLLGVAAVWSKSVDGTYLLPFDERNGESYKQYLNRVPVEVGLLAEFTAASVYSLPHMMSYSYIADREKHARNFCLSDFEGSYDSCASRWRHVMTHLRYPDAQLSELTSIAATTCPKPSQGPPEHSVLQRVHGGPTPSSLVVLLQDMDAKYLNGTIQKLQDYIGCKLSPAYESKGEGR